jgi:methylenetetrahydrofolate reductase (NADPH)
MSGERGGKKEKKQRQQQQKKKKEEKEMKKKKKKKKEHVPLATLISNAMNHSTNFFYSFEFSPARDPNPIDLFNRIERMSNDLKPLWVDITWGFGDIGSRSIDAARQIQKTLNVPVLMHFICTDKTTTQLEKSLNDARSAGVRAILALRGYTQSGFDKWQKCDDGDGNEPQHADELVRFIKESHGDWFSIGVAGFPEGHPESENGIDDDIIHLKNKIKNGAEFIICQFCFDSTVFHKYVQKCRDNHINVPILPGIMPLTEYSTAKLLSDLWHVKLPTSIEKRLRECQEKGNDGGRMYGEEFTTDLCESLLRPSNNESKSSNGIGSGGRGLHFFVYDAEWEVRAIINNLKERAFSFQ